MEYPLRRAYASRSDRRHFFPPLPIAEPHDSRTDFRSLYLTERIRAISAPRRNDPMTSSLQKFKVYGQLKYTRTKICDHRPTHEQMTAKATSAAAENKTPMKLPSLVIPVQTLRRHKLLKKPILHVTETPRSRRSSGTKDACAGEIASMTKKNISYKYFFLPRLTSIYVTDVQLMGGIRGGPKGGASGKS